MKPTVHTDTATGQRIILLDTGWTVKIESHPHAPIIVLTPTGGQLTIPTWEAQTLVDAIMTLTRPAAA